ncbi:ABC transporter substrate-binding protein [Bacillus pumilus]|uniref:AraC family transcriptional regulator n=2 Tax=Bacillus pumilus TaxID=1408 RepID=A8FJC7_BACP2|nr:ABC transporter substrate-binding protein [Bacillus pumilus]ABV64344.1 AraC family transcriptional regulator [Bacillus pumilus SAFR-032]MBC3643932.1 ABC transporter substrate-binding protein [Bacillus pumilus]MBC3647448.1 ABC transporter substrate-binding protein [Bacillus pumilus]MBC3651427.1 ABC transporter substrate-binding protein [Bacillus pumilus]MBC3654452.1 ABC transporter substrate-binding protein [Bacillus pumilus]
MNNNPRPELTDAGHFIYRLISVEKIHHTALPHVEQQLSDAYCLLFSLKSSGFLFINDKKGRLTDETLYTIMPNDTFMLDTVPNQKHELYLVRFHIYAMLHDEIIPISQENAKSLLNAWQFVHTDAFDQIHYSLSQMIDLWKKNDSVHSFQCQLLFQSLILKLLTLHQHKVGDTAQALLKTKQYINDHSDEPIRLATLAKMAGISPNHYSEQFKKQFGQSVTDYVTRKRLTRAKQLIAQGHNKLRNIAQEIGYQDPYYFSRLFKKKTGITPSQYMKSRQRKIIAYGPSILGQFTPLHLLPYAAPLHPKWTAYDFEHYGDDIPIHLNAHRVNQHSEIDIQQVQKAQPELIIANDQITKEEKEALQSICPVHFVPFKLLNWRAQFQETAALLGEEKEAEEWLIHYDELVEYTKRVCSHRKKTMLPIRVYQDQLYLYVNRTMSEVILEEIGVPPAFHQTSSLIEQKIDIAFIQQCDPDCIFLLLHKEPDTIAFYHQLKQQEAWQNIRAVARQAVYSLSSDPWREYSAASHLRVIQHLLSFYP